MALWLVRAGSNGEQEEAAIENKVVTIGWNDLPDLSKVASRDELKSAYSNVYPGSKKHSIANVAGQIWRFAHEIKKDDLVVLPLKRSANIAIGRVDGPYKFIEGKDKILRYVIPVQWIKTDIPRTAFEQDLLYSFGAFMTVCQINRNNALERVKAVLDGKRLNIPLGFEASDDEVADIEQMARDQLISFINQNFKGHDLTHLVAAILKTQGYHTFISPPGADGGIDILAGKGPMGFDRPHLAVQVKSSASPADVEVVRSFEGAAKRHDADSLLFVSWGGFNRAVYKECKSSFFNLRFWTSDDLLDALFVNYDKLDANMQAELPLKRIWSVVLED